MKGDIQMSYMWNNVLLAKGVHKAEKPKCSRVKTQIKTPTKLHNAQMLLSVRRLLIAWLFNYMSECF